MTFAIDGDMDVGIGKECFSLVLMLFLYNQVGFRTVGIVAKGRTKKFNMLPPLSQSFACSCTCRIIGIPDLLHIGRNALQLMNQR